MTRKTKPSIDDVIEALDTTHALVNFGDPDLINLRREVSDLIWAVTDLAKIVRGMQQ